MRSNPRTELVSLVGLGLTLAAGNLVFLSQYLAYVVH